MEYTKEVWIKAENIDGSYDIIDSNDDVIAIMTRHKNKETNANLIIAALDLYETAKKLRSLVDEFLMYGLMWDKDKLNEWKVSASFASNDVLFAMNKAEEK